VYSAAFVAEEWIKSMPCGKDADCLPEKLSRPGTMGGSVSDSNSSIGPVCRDNVNENDSFVSRLSGLFAITLKGVEKVDVMEYLNIRKAAPVAEKNEKETAP